MGFFFKYAGIAAITALITYLAISFFSGEDRAIIQESYQQKLDSLNTVIANGVRSREAIFDSLQAKDQALRTYVEKTDDQIASYTNIIGSLKLRADKLHDSLSAQSEYYSLLSLMKKDSASVAKFTDTTFTHNKTWTDSLFLTTAYAHIFSDSLRMDVKLQQLRGIDLDIVTTISDDKTRINTFVRSPDFDSLQATSFTELTPVKRKPWGWSIAGVILLVEALRIIF